MNRRQLIASVAAAAVAPALPAPLARGGFVGEFLIGKNTGVVPIDVVWISRNWMLTANGEIRSAQRTG